jgi:PKHD-type hydroxylase
MFWFEPPNQLVGWEYTVNNVLNNSDIEFIEDYVNRNKNLLSKAEIKTASTPIDTEYRRSRIMFLTDINAFKQIYDKVLKVVHDVNNIHFKYAVSYNEPLQYSVYDSTELGYYNIHCDSTLRNTSGFTRKISYSILLTDTTEFEGGDLLLHTSKSPINLPLKKGSMVLFPSFSPHSVTPVTKGTRKTIVGWMCGPNLV